MPGDTGRDSENMRATTSAASSSVPDSIAANMPSGTTSTSGTMHDISTSASSSEGRSASSTMAEEQRIQPLEASERAPSSQPTAPEKIPVIAPLQYQINELTRKVGTAPLWSTSLPGVNEPSLNLQEASKSLGWECMDAMLAHFPAEKQILTQDVLLRVFASPGVAVPLATWKSDILDRDEDGHLLYALTEGDFTPNTKEVELLALCAWYLPQLEAKGLRLCHRQKIGIMQCAPTVREIAEGMMPHVMQYLNPSAIPDVARFLYELSARILSLAYTDLEINKSEARFFSVLLGSVFTRPISLEAHEQWEPYLGLTHKVAKQSPEHLNPFISIHTAVLAFSQKWGVEGPRVKRLDGGILKVTELATTTNSRLSELQRALHGKADSDRRLLTAFDVTAPSLPPTKLPQRIMSAYTPVTPKQAQRKRGRGAKATVQVDGGTASKTKKPKVNPKLPAQAHTTTDVSTPLEETAAPESNMHGSATGKKRKVTAAPNSATRDLSTANQKRGRVAAATTSSNGATRPEPQDNVVSTQLEGATDPQEDREGVTVRLEDADELPELEPQPIPTPIEDVRFATVNGRIVPSSKRTNPGAKSDRFTCTQQLVLYTRYKEVITAHRNQGRCGLTAEQWFELWQEVAYVLSGRGVWNCIEFYVENEEKFDF